MLRFEDIVFGPIQSRRLGASLGVNLLPAHGKICNFDCVYCECGWNKDGRDDKKLPGYEEVSNALESRLKQLSENGTIVDTITFSGNGEPTMNPDFPQIIDKTLQLRDKFYPHAKVSVLSNATLIAREAVFQALCKVDNPIMKIDASSDQLIGKINKPAGSYNLDDIVEGLKRFDGNFILQTMFLRSEDFDTVADGALERWMDIVRELRPREVMVYTIDRETPQSNLQKYSVEQMQEMVRPLVEEGFKVQVRG